MATESVPSTVPFDPKSCCGPEFCCSPILSSTLPAEDAVELAAVLKALADPIRLQLLSIISNAGQACACDFPSLVDRSQPTISHHLTQLVKAGIIDREQRGKWAWYQVNNGQMRSIQSAIG